MQHVYNSLYIVIQTPVSKKDINDRNKDSNIKNWQIEVIMFFLNNVFFFISMKLLML